MPTPKNAERQTVLRGDIRKWMDRLEAACYSQKPLILQPGECQELDLVFRRIQDEAGRVLGYE